MHNKTKLIDINMVSAYLGRFATAITAVTVLVITGAALLTRGGLRDHSTLAIAIPTSGNAEKAQSDYEPLRSLIARHARRPARTLVATDAWPDDCELYVMSSEDFLAERGRLNLVAIYSVVAGTVAPDAAVLVVAAGQPSPPLETLVTAQVVFSDPGSAGGCWQQLKAITEAGGRVDPATMKFAEPTRTGGRAVLDVISGRYRVGAARRSDLERLIEEGIVGRNEVKVIHSQPLAAETVIAVRADDEAYFREQLEAVRSALLGLENSPVQRAEATLLRNRGFGGLVPFTPADLDRLSALRAFREAAIGSSR